MKYSKNRQAGFTLIELLLVMFILGIVASTAIVSMRTSGAGDKPFWGKQFERQITYAQDIAVLGQKQLALQFNKRQVRFLAYTGDTWVEADREKLTGLEIPEKADVVLYLNHNVVPLEEKFEKMQPQVLFDNSLEYMPFELQVHEQEQKHVFKLSEIGEFSYEVSAQ